MINHLHHIKIQDKVRRKVERHKDSQVVKIMGNMGSKLHMANKQLKANKQHKDMDNKWAILMGQLNNIHSNNIILHNRQEQEHKEVMDKVWDNKDMDNKDMDNKLHNTIHMVWVIQIKWDSQDKSKCPIMEQHHNHNLMGLQDKKILLRM